MNYSNILYKTLKRSAVFLLITIVAVACRKNLLNTIPPTQVLSGNMWTTDNLTDLGVNGVYQAMRANIGTGGTSDRELYQYDRFSGLMPRDNQPLLNATATTANGLFSSVWQELYEGVHRANDAIDGITKISPSAPEKKARLIAESKFLRAYFYYRLNQLYRGVPIYLEPITYDGATLPRNTEQQVWDQIVTDLTDCINETNLPDKYAATSTEFGRATKGAAYALRGKVYMYTSRWELAIADFEKVKELGYSLFNNYRTLFTEANERSSETIFSIQNIPVNGYGSTFQFYFGSRSAFGSNWNTYLIHPDIVDLYENADGSKFNWNDYIPGYNEMEPKLREVFFLRNNLTPTEIQNMTTKGLNMSLYLPTGNEQRISAAYANRDPRLQANIILPYSTFLGNNNGVDQNFTSRWPFRNEFGGVFDLRTDTRSFFYYLPRKFVYEGAVPSIPNRTSGGTDYPVIRYADILLLWAEALNESDKTADAVLKVNEVRARAGVGLLNSSAATTVSGKDDLRTRIQNERRRELLAEGNVFFDELRWKTWKDHVFYPGNGIKQVWGDLTAPFTWGGDNLYIWAIPQVEMERNTSLTQNPGWIN